MFTTSRGSPLPLGAHMSEAKQLRKAVNFAIFSEHASAVKLCLFSEDKTPLEEIPLTFKTGNVWHVCVHNLPSLFCYAYKMDGPKNTPGYFFDANKLLIDPYAKNLLSDHAWGKTPAKNYHPLGVFSQEESFHDFDWENDQPLHISHQDLVIYEMHVRGFTIDKSSETAYPGTYKGLIEKIPYLKDLGINAIELLPIHEFNETDCITINPFTKEHLYNYWGYATLHFFSPMNRYSSSHTIGSATREFKEMVKQLHKNGIEVILDVVFNHTGEGNEKGSTFSFRGLDNPIYYLLDANQVYTNYTGCGNTFNCNQPVAAQFILDCMRYWVLEMHIDGFRFDLASILTRNTKGVPVEPSLVLELISQDPVLAKVKLIAEPWDAAGLYHVGGFYPQKNRWSEWNGKYRDAIRKFIKGTPGLKGEFATRLCGSQDLYGHGRSPCSSINFVNAHDGFTLADLVSYNHKHNEVNGEHNRDGTDVNDSWNCGFEGTSIDRRITHLRHRQIRNYHLALMVSQGVPMICMGDEYGHSKQGNNNTWCQDNTLNWFLWGHLNEENELNKGFYRFYKLMIQFRHEHANFRRASFLEPKDIEWHGIKLHTPEWNKNPNALAFTLKDYTHGEDIYVAFNAQHQPQCFILPPCNTGKVWQWIANTFNPTPFDFFDKTTPQYMHSVKMRMAPYSAVILKQVMPKE